MPTWMMRPCVEPEALHSRLDDAIGDWAFHCHMLMHMHAGMMRVVTVRYEEEAA